MFAMPNKTHMQYLCLLLLIFVIMFCAGDGCTQLKKYLRGGTLIETLREPLYI